MTETKDRISESELTDFCLSQAKNIAGYARMIREAAYAPETPILMVVAMDLNCPYASTLASPMLATLGDAGTRAIKTAREKKAVPVAMGVVTTSVVLKTLGSTFPDISRGITLYRGKDPLVLVATAGGVQVFVHSGS